jgi:DNA-binding transcriptional LysR family regulator
MFAAPAYLAKNAEPKTLGDLDRHRIVTFGVPVPPGIRDVNWLEIAGREHGHPREPALKINNIYAVKKAVERGAGIAILPDYMIEPDSKLVRLLADAEVPTFDTYFTYPAELKNSARVHVFRDFLLSKAQNWSY